MTRNTRPGARYHLKFCGRPLCDHMGSQAGLKLCEAANVDTCSHRTLSDARKAMRRLNRQPGYAGAVSIHGGECPRVQEV